MLTSFFSIVTVVSAMQCICYSCLKYMCCAFVLLFLLLLVFLKKHPSVDLTSFICSTSVFGVSTESMQLSFDSRGNSVPTILLMMQQRLYMQEGLQVCDRRTLVPLLPINSHLKCISVYIHRNFFLKLGFSFTDSFDL